MNIKKNIWFFKIKFNSNCDYIALITGSSENIIVKNSM